jgi:hypothetical protein
MSTDAISFVTKALRALVASQMTSGSLVTLLPPGEDPPTGSGVNLYMYRTNESPYLKNVDWPGDRSGAPSRPEPALSLELFYLLTPFAARPQPNDVEDAAHRMLGQAMLVLHEHPILNRVHLPGFDANVALPDFLLNSYEDIRIRLHPVSMDELSKIWSTIGKPYRLSVAYEVTLVQLTPTMPPTLAAGLVQSTGLTVVTIGAPRITTLSPAQGPLTARVSGQPTPTPVVVNGFGFSFLAETPIVTVGDVAVALSGTPTDRQITVLLPSRLPAGPEVDVRVRVNGRWSQPLTFTVTPWISSLTPIRTALDPTRPADGRLNLSGSGFTKPAEIFGSGTNPPWSVTTFLPGATANQLAITLPAAATSNGAAGSALRNGIYDVFVRLQDNRISNARSVEVIPQLNGISGYPANSNSGYDSSTGILTLVGARLDGADVRIVVDGQEFAIGANTSATQLTQTFVRRLAPGAHTVGVTVDAHNSREIVISA